MTHEVPEGWVKTEIGKHLNITTGFPFKSKQFSNNPNDGKPLIRIRDILTQKPETYYSGEVPEGYEVTQGDTLIGMDGDFHLRKWKAEPALLNQRICKVSSANIELLNDDYLFHFLGPELIQIHKGIAGTTVKHLSTKHLKSINTNLPPLPEQKKIAEVLSSVDEAITATKAVIDQTKQVKKGLLQTLLTKGIGHTKFKQTPLGETPESWDFATLDELTPSDRKITYGIVQAGPHVDDGVPYIRVSDMAEDGLSLEGMLRTSHEIAGKYKRSEVHTGDVVYALRGKIGHVLPVPEILGGANLTQGTARIAPGIRITSDFLYWAMCSPHTVKQAMREIKGSTFKEITLKKLKSLIIPVPPKAEQNEIVEKCGSVEANLRKAESELTQLQTLKSGLMSDLLTGRKRVEV